MSDHLTDQLRNWSPGQAMLPPDPGGLNRALDRVAAEHLREVAPGLAPDASGYPFLSDERPPAPAPPAEATRESVETTIRNEVRRHPVGGYDYVHVERAAATGEMSREEVVGFLSAVQDASIDADPRWLDNGVAAVLANDRALRARANTAGELWLCEGCGKVQTRPPEGGGHFTPPDDHCGPVVPLADGIAALRTRAREAEERAERYAALVVELRRERDEAREQRDAAHAEANDLRSRVERLVAGAAKLAERAEEAEEEVRLADFRVSAAESRADDLLARLAAANFRADEAERMRDAYKRAKPENDERFIGERDIARQERDTERAARLKAEAERDELERRCDTRHSRLATELSERLAAAEAEVKRLNDVVDEHAGDAARAGLERAKTERKLREATEEIVRVSLAYDDPSLDATDGAHPAWWRGSDAGVAGAVRIINEALDGPLPLVGCVGGADLERVRQRVAALRARAQRLVEAGDRMAEQRRPDDPLRIVWAAAKVQP